MNKHAPIETFGEVLDQIYRAEDTRAARWLSSLPVYKCAICGADTIFKGGCGRHDEESDSE